ncbi:RAM signaling pathway protein-domain-containing protein [Limtongia smithiae]|uniref:RAM signaling pathway protein-domain-containing protein n=1 Tax=Limtongia smithiae TaxID=1125753 RepID=UPI0034CD35A5
MSSEPLERLRSNSESVLAGSSRAAKRMGFVVARRTTPAVPPQGPPPPPPLHDPPLPPIAHTQHRVHTRAYHRAHARGVSHDSAFEIAFDAGLPGAASGAASAALFPPAVPASSETPVPIPTTTSRSSPHDLHDASPAAYFRRHAVVRLAFPAAAPYSAAAATTVEAARGLLPALLHFLDVVPDRLLGDSLLALAHAARAHNVSLVRALDHHDALLASARKPNMAISAVEPITHAAIAAIASFRAIVATLHSHAVLLSANADIRHTRAFFLSLYGALAEVRNAWTALLPALADSRLPPSAFVPAEDAIPGSSAPPAPPITASPPQPSPPPLPTSIPLPALSFLPIQTSLKSPTSLAGMPSPITTTMTVPTSNNVFFSSALLSPGIGTPGLSQLPLPTPGPGNDSTSPYAFHFPLEPSEADEELFDRIHTATSAALTVLALVLDGMSTQEAARAATLPVTSSQQPTAPTQRSPKSDELKHMCDIGLEISTSLRGHLQALRGRGGDHAERARFAEETSTFVRVIINMLEVTKVLLNDYPFLIDARPQLSSLTRLTKDVLTGSLKPAEKAAAERDVTAVLVSLPPPAPATVAIT